MLVLIYSLSTFVHFFCFCLDNNSFWFWMLCSWMDSCASRFIFKQLQYCVIMATRYCFFQLQAAEQHTENSNNTSTATPNPRGVEKRLHGCRTGPKNRRRRRKFKPSLPSIKTVKVSLLSFLMTRPDRF